jgi:hypothetical protein
VLARAKSSRSADPVGGTSHGERYRSPVSAWLAPRLQSLREPMGACAFGATFEEGRRMTPEQAVQIALDA